MGDGLPCPGAEDLDLLVSLGGDGTMLRAVGLVLGADVPVLGVNFGRFGYLAAVEPDGLHRAIERFLVGDYELERRMTADVRVMLKGTKSIRYRSTALNDITLARPSGMHTINANVSIRGQRFLSYAADAMIVATAYGVDRLQPFGPRADSLAEVTVLGTDAGGGAHVVRPQPHPRRYGRGVLRTARPFGGGPDR